MLKELLSRNKITSLVGAAGSVLWLLTSTESANALQAIRDVGPSFLFFVAALKAAVPPVTAFLLALVARDSEALKPKAAPTE